MHPFFQPNYFLVIDVHKKEVKQKNEKKVLSSSITSYHYTFNSPSSVGHNISLESTLIFNSHQTSSSTLVWVILRIFS